MVGLLLIAGLVVAQNLQAAAVRECEHHGGSAHFVVDDADGSGSEAHGRHDAPVPEAPHPGPDATPDSDSESHAGPCDCLGPCGASTAADAPAATVESAFADVAPRRIAAAEARESGLPRHVHSFFLPYPNAPPA